MLESPSIPAEHLPIKIAELLATRLCHDITGPVGAINNGAELLAEDPENASDAADLIASSARDAVCRIRFFRLCYGAPKPGNSLAMGDLTSITNDYIQHGKCSLGWQLTAREHQSGSIFPGDARLLCNMVMIADEALIRGGRISLSSSDGANHILYRLEAEGMRLHMEDAKIRMLLGMDQPENASASSVQIAWTRMLLNQLKAECHVDYSAEQNRMMMTVTRPQHG